MKIQLLLEIDLEDPKWDESLKTCPLKEIFHRAEDSQIGRTDLLLCATIFSVKRGDEIDGHFHGEFLNQHGYYCDDNGKTEFVDLAK